MQSHLEFRLTLRSNRNLETVCDRAQAQVSAAFTDHS